MEGVFLEACLRPQKNKDNAQKIDSWDRGVMLIGEVTFVLDRQESIFAKKIANRK